MPLRTRLGIVLGALFGVLAVVVGAVTVTLNADRLPQPQRSGLQVHVVDEDGARIPAATVTMLRIAGGSADGATPQRTSTDEKGSFPFPYLRPRLVRVTAPGHLSRVQVIGPETRDVVLVRRSRTVSLGFGGDVVFGRRYYTAQGRRPALLSRGASVPEHAALLRRVRPMLADADVMAVNLETALVPSTDLIPIAPADLARRRQLGLHPTKPLVITSATESALALADSGVDVVSLANNHSYDATAAGMTSTVRALDDAGIQHFGGGRTIDEAWRPAYVTRRGTTIGYVGCSDVTGRRFAVRYVATARQGGAAACSAARLATAVRQARVRADVVVVMMHGDVEYVRTQTSRMRMLAEVARHAGARLVVDGHPHVVGGVRPMHTAGGSLFAESMGNLLFDQDLWETLVSYLLRVDVRAGRPVLARVDPFVLDDYVPTPVAGAPADAVARLAAGLVGDATVTDNGEAVLSASSAARRERTNFRVNGLSVLPHDVWPTGAEPAGGTATVGEDLLRGTGGFEPDGIGTERRHVALWATSRWARPSDVAACTGLRGMRLARSPLSSRDVVTSPAHRVAVTAGQALTAVVDVGRATTVAEFELRWYASTTGPSESLIRVPVPATDSRSPGCRRVRLDATVPPGVVAAQPFVRLQPPHGGAEGHELWVDDVRLVAWAPTGAGGPRYDVIDAPGPVDLPVVRVR